jgi:alpha/beta superfamily hydrolase
MPSIRVQFVHGLEGSPRGAKARLFAQHFETRTPAMDTSDFEACVELHEACLRSFAPDVLVGSSFGAAVVVEILRRGAWTGPTLLLAQAALRYDPEARLPPDVPVWLVHGLRDEMVDPAESRRLARTGSPGRVRLIEVDDDHGLHGLVESDGLVRTVRQLVALHGAASPRV